MSSPETTVVDHDTLAQALHEAGVSASAAEVHGIVSGVVCATGVANDPWQQLVLGRELAHAPPALANLLQALHRQTEAQLGGGELDLELLLPDDEADMASQIEGLADWCRGFLLGFDATRGKGAPELAGDAGEVLEDLARIAEVNPESGEEDEESARAFAELTEYVRMGVQLVYEELYPREAGERVR